MSSKNTKKIIYKIVITALMASLACVATMIIKIPSPMKGYLNLGDGIVLLSGWLLPPSHGFLAAGLGSALADIISGYPSYALATFVIKGIMAVVIHTSFKMFENKLGSFVAQIIGGVLAEIIMVIGYFGFEGILYGFAPSALNIPANAVQGVAGIIVSSALIALFKKSKVDFQSLKKL